MPGEMHTGGHETLTLTNDHLDMMGVTMVAWVDENTLYISAAEGRGNCKRK
jgi:hypothetical protein